MTGVTSWWEQWVRGIRDRAEGRRRRALTRSLLPLLNSESELALALSRHGKRLWYPHLREQVESLTRASEAAVQKLREAVVAQGLTPAPPATVADEEMSVVECLGQDVEQLRALALAYRDAVDLARQAQDEKLAALLSALHQEKTDHRQILLRLVTGLDSYAR